MKPELEVKFLDIDIETMRQCLKSAGATLETPLRLMRRVLIEQPQHAAENAFLRIRDEGDKVTLTFKRRDSSRAGTMDSTKEIEVMVSDFDKTVEIFDQAGWKYKTYQETKRETWQLGESEVVIDEWPWIPPYIEIEGPSEAAVKQAAMQLELSWDDAEYDQIDGLYAQHYTFAEGVRGVIDVPEVRFADPVPEQFKG